MFDRDWLVSECERVRTHKTLEEFSAHMRSFADRLGYFQYAYLALPYFFELGADKSPPPFLTIYNKDWMRHYTENRYDLDDPALRHCLSGSETPFLWPRSKEIEQLPPKEKKVCQEAGEAGIRHGFTLPMHNGMGGVGILSLSFDGSGSEFERFYADRREATERFAYSFNEAVLSRVANHFGRLHLPRLTPKERETLKWLAGGNTYEETADRQKVGVGTIRKHAGNAFRKLKARNGAHACALVSQWGLLA